MIHAGFLGSSRSVALVLFFWGASTCTPPPVTQDQRTSSSPSSAEGGPAVVPQPGSSLPSPTSTTSAPPTLGGNPTSTTTNTATGEESPSKEVSVPALLRVIVTEEGQLSPITYDDLKPMVTQNCLGCHGPGQPTPPPGSPTAPLNMSGWPYTSRFNDPQALVAEIILRLASTSAPMPPPPAPPLTPQQQALWQQWADEGYLLKAPPTPDLPFLQGVQILWEWRTEGTPLWRATVSPWIPGGEFVGTLTNLTENKPFEAKVTLRGEDGKIIETRHFSGQKTNLKLEATLKVSVSLIKSHAIDRTAPSPGNAGQVVAANLSDEGLDVRWSLAQDDLAPSETLAYAVYIGDENPLASVAEIQSKARLLKDFAPKITSIQIDQLVPGKTYKIYVLVRDGAGNTRSYETLTVTTKPDGTPPLVTNRSLIASELTDTEVRISWITATDKVSPPSKLNYELVTASQPILTDLTNALSNGTSAGKPALNASTFMVGGLAPSETYWMTVIVRDEGNNASLYDQISIKTLPATGTLDQASYAKQCAARLGSLRPFNCLDGQIAPITLDGVPIPPNLTASQAAAYPFGTTPATQFQCDRPALLGMSDQGQCIPYSRYGRLPSFRPDGSEQKEVDTVFACRHYKARLGPQGFQGVTIDGSVVPLYEDIAIIQHNRVTGETCWFQRLTPDTDGRRVPPPSETALPAGSPAYALSAANFWLSPLATFNVGCHKCHDSDPWIHSPYIDQVRLPDGSPLVPSGMKLTASPRKYSMLGARIFNSWEKAQGIGVVPVSGSKSCTSCHTIGNFMSCTDWTKQSVGASLAKNVSPKGAAWPLSHWMPPSDPVLQTLDQWNASGYKAAADQQIACCANPAATGCTSVPIMTVPPPYVQ